MSNTNAACACGLRGNLINKTSGSSRWIAMTIRSEAGTAEHSSNWWLDEQGDRAGICTETGRRWRG